MQLETLAVLKSIPYFADIPVETLGELAAAAVRKNFPKNLVIINEGDEAGPLFIILQGQVKVYLNNESGREVTLCTQRTGTYFGELSLLDNELRSASVMTMEPTVCALIPRNVFTNWLRKHPDEVGLSIMRGLTRRIRELTENVRGLALSDVYGRLIKMLQNLATQEGEEWLIREKLSHRDIANMLGCSREMVTRLMGDLVAGGWITIEPKSKYIRIHKKLAPRW